MLHLGRWTHEVPLELPPAPRAMVPELGLSYASGTEDGPVGVGWQLEGMHRIERKAAGGGDPGTTASSTDEFYLDG